MTHTRFFANVHFKPLTTVPPTAAPKRCECDVKITCESEDEIECNAFSIPTLACASSLSEVRFQYTGGDCSDSNNDQRDDVCEDTNGGPPADTEVLVQCLDSESNAVLASELLSPGGTIDVLAGGWRTFAREIGMPCLFHG